MYTLDVCMIFTSWLKTSLICQPLFLAGFLSFVTHPFIFYFSSSSSDGV